MQTIAAFDKHIAPLYGALAKAQGEFTEVRKTRTASFETRSGDVVSYNYADLSDFIEMVRPVLSKHGLGYYQHVRPRADAPEKLEIVTVLFHDSGAYLESLHPLYIDDSKKMSPMQTLGTAETFGRRYALSMILGIASEDDTDDTNQDVIDPETDSEMAKVQKFIKGAKVQKTTKTKTARALYAELQEDIRLSDSIASLEMFATYRAKDIASLPKDWESDILKQYREKLIAKKSEPPQDEARAEDEPSIGLDNEKKGEK